MSASILYAALHPFHPGGSTPATNDLSDDVIDGDDIDTDTEFDNLDGEITSLENEISAVAGRLGIDVPADADSILAGDDIDGLNDDSI